MLARAFRPQRLSELIGQDALVRTLTQAFASGRIAHAFLLSGIRGVGKTTVARIIARGLNCTGPDGHGGPTVEPCGLCPSCRAIAEERSFDVIETDAASHTGKDDIQEIIEGVQYAPAASRFKVYIFDEVHMLSEKAWNSLLKTVEEPPPHVKFIFATTEVRKVPVTVVSRCQRFDLRRVETEVLARHLRRICEQEHIRADERALALIARAGQGSVRDALSLLDQAATAGAGHVEVTDVEAMLGLADRSRLFELFEHILRGEPGPAVALFGELWARGADPAALARDLLDLVYGLTRMLLGDASTLESFGLDAAGLERARRIAGELSHPRLQRLWQMLLRGLGDIGLAPDPRAAGEMLLVRLACVSDLPPPAELVQMLRGETRPSRQATTPVGRDLFDGLQGSPPEGGRRAPEKGSGEAEAGPKRSPPRDLRELVRLLQEVGEPFLAAAVRQRVHPIRFEPGRMEFALSPGPVQDLPNRLSAVLERAVGGRWVVVVGHDRSRPTLAEEEQAERQARLEAVRADPIVRQALATFPGARIVEVEPLGESQDKRTGEG
ncbi:DNA polymerase III subunit tau [bacterium HR40]|nr:DNA polymerase III subunit tau [bacterium HR40]